MTDSGQAMQKHLDAIWARSKPDIEGRVDAIEAAAIGLLDETLASDVRELAERAAHKLAGIAGTFGFPQATILAREAEHLLRGEHEIGPADVVRLSAIAIELRRDLIETARNASGNSGPVPDVAKASTRVVMVDDDPTMIALVTALLANHGIAVSGTSSPAELWATLEADAPDLLLLDVDMPGLTGIELCRAVRADPRWDAMPVVFLTSRTAAAVELFDAGADNYLTKPVDSGELLSVVRSRVRRTRSIRAIEPDAASPAPAAVAPSDSPRKADFDVILVDDDEVLVELLCHAITARGYTAKSLGDGTAAMTQLAGGNPPLRGRVIVLDVGLPEHDGLAVLRALARDGITTSSRVIMLTARSLESEVIQALDLGAFDHVSKPFSVPVLMHRIRRALDDRSAGP